jgi:hypothetical protein
MPDSQYNSFSSRSLDLRWFLFCSLELPDHWRATLLCDSPATTVDAGSTKSRKLGLTFEFCLLIVLLLRLDWWMASRLKNT